jgi:hypothetical protein
MRSYEVYDVMHMIPQRLVVTMGLDRSALYRIIALTILLGERGMVLVLECPAYLTAVTRRMLKASAGCPEARHVGRSTWQCQSTRRYPQVHATEVDGSWALYGKFHDHSWRLSLLTCLLTRCCNQTR